MADTKTVHICLSSGDTAHVIIDREGSTRDTHCAVHDVPVTVNAIKVIQQMNQLAFWPWPKTLSWPMIADLPLGSVVRPRQSITA